MKKNLYVLSTIFIIVLFLSLRLYNLKKSFIFGADQGMTLLETYKVYQSGKPTLISQTGSSLTVYGRYFYFGSALYYILMPVLVLFSWNPLSAGYYLIALNLFVLLLLYKTIRSVTKSYYGAVFFSLLCTFSPFMIYYSRFPWSPNFLIPLAGIVLLLLISMQEKKKHLWRMIFTGFFLGLGLQIHYSFFQIIIISFIWLVVGRRLNLKNGLLLLTGFSVGFSPLILFELRHNFYNLQTLFLFFSVKSAGGKMDIVKPQIHYFLCLFPFIYYAISLILAKFQKKHALLCAVLLICYIIYSLFNIIPQLNSGYIVAPGWTYTGLKRAEKIILFEDLKNYNVVDLLTGDTRAMALRYLLTIAGKAPLDVVSYPSASSLFIYSKVPIGQILKGHLWEIDSIKPVKLQKQWHLQNDIFLYLVEKTK